MNHLKTFESFESPIIEEKNWIKDAIKNPGSLRKSLHKKKGQKISNSEIENEISILKNKDRDPDKKGIQLGQKDKKKYSRLNLAKTLRNMN